MAPAPSGRESCTAKPDKPNACFCAELSTVASTVPEGAVETPAAAAAATSRPVDPRVTQAPTAVAACFRRDVNVATEFFDNDPFVTRTRKLPAFGKSDRFGCTERDEDEVPA
jgi:hypothetical protein